MPASRQPIDQAYKLFFSDREMVKSLLLDFVHEPFVRELDLSTLQLWTKEHIDERLRERRGDIVWRVRWRASWAYLIILLEFQSRPDPLMAFRMLEYSTLAWSGLLRSREARAGTLPPLFPIVIYNGRAPWNVSLDISGLLLPEARHLGAWIPMQKYFLVDAWRLGKSEGREGVASLLFRLERAEDFDDARQICIELAQVLKTPALAPLKNAFRVWLNIFKTGKGEAEPLSHTLEDENMGLAENMEKWAQDFMRQGKEMGLREGEAKGLREGEAKGLREGEAKGLREGEAKGLREGLVQGRLAAMALALTEALKAKFGPAASDSLARIEEIKDYEALNSLIPKAVLATSPEDFARELDALEK